MPTAQEAIRAGVITAQAAFCGLTDKDVENLVASGFGHIQLIVKLRASYDSVQHMTADQLHHAPPELTEAVRTVFVSGSDAGLNLFNAEIPDVKTPLQRRRPFPQLPIARATLDALEDALEAQSPDGISWAWSDYSSPYVPAKVLLILTDCRSVDGITTSVLLNDDPEIDCRNLANVLRLFTARATVLRTRVA